MTVTGIFLINQSELNINQNEKNVSAEETHESKGSRFPPKDEVRRRKESPVRKAPQGAQNHQPEAAGREIVLKDACQTIQAA